MKVFFAADHAGFELKNTLIEFVRDELGYNTEDCGAYALEEHDDYPDFIAEAAGAVARDPAGSRAVVLGASGEGEAMVANRFKGVRAAVYYGPAAHTQTDADGNVLDILASTRSHNDANVLSLGMRFINEAEAKDAIRTWLTVPFSEDEDHRRRIYKIDNINDLTLPPA